MIVSLIHNLKLKRWHPVYFRPSPQPSSETTDTAQRYKSGGHHTDGFPTREEAIESAKAIAQNIETTYGGTTVLSVENDFPWDGEDVPAMVVFFAVDGDKAIPLF